MSIFLYIYFFLIFRLKRVLAKGQFENELSFYSMMSGVPGPPPGGGNLMGPDQNQSNMLNIKPEPEFKTEVCGH